MALKLHRSPATFLKTSGHPCWRVQSALDEAGIKEERLTPDGSEAT